MPKRRRGAINSSDESEEEPIAAVNTVKNFESVRARKRRLQRHSSTNFDDQNHRDASDSSSSENEASTNKIESRNSVPPSLLRVAHENDLNAEDSNENEFNEEDSNENDLNEENSARAPHSRAELLSPDASPTPRFPVVLRTNSRRTVKDSDDSYSDQLSSSDHSNSSDLSEVELEYSDGGFLVDSDDNAVRKSAAPRTRRQRRQIRHQRRAKRRHAKPSPTVSSDDEFSASEHSLAAELRELNDDVEPAKKLRHYRERAPVNYAIPPPPTVEEIASLADKVSASSSAQKKVRVRRLYDVGGPFGGQDAHTIFAVPKPDLVRAVAHGKHVKGAIDRAHQAVSALSAPALTNAAAGDRIDSADVSPVEINDEIDFEMVGGLDDYIAKLKEMVSLPLLYPELYAKFRITPPRGVLFHGPPGTGKTLMARALAASHREPKVTFYMRKGADVLSKWVGESERQLRALFDEAQKNQPSIIFFDEIDGLAPVRSARQEQHHASIVSTLLALMDGMADRGQVVVIGATNRPDSVDPALRRPGRFDREFYFPLPNFAARQRILQIHTAKWHTPPAPEVIAEIAKQTRGFGGADLRAVTTEAALLAIQRAYPQIYQSSSKLSLELTDLQVLPSDFAQALESVQPSSARLAGQTLAQPLPARVAPLLANTVLVTKNHLDKVFPPENRGSKTANKTSRWLSEPQIQQVRELSRFCQTRVHRPRLVLLSDDGAAPAYLLRAAAHHLEGVYTRELSFNTIFSAQTTPEAAIVSLVAETRQRAPACLLLPLIDEWQTAPHLESLLLGLLHSLLPTEPVLVLATANAGLSSPWHTFFETECVTIALNRDSETAMQFFAPILRFVERPPPQCQSVAELPAQIPPPLPVAIAKNDLIPNSPNYPPKDSQVSNTETDGEEKPTSVFSVSERAELRVRSQLKLKLGVVLDGFRQRYRRFRKPVIDESQLAYLFEPAANDNDEAFRCTANNMILEVSTNKQYHNMDLETVEDRLWNGFYCEPAQFLADMEMIYHDCVTLGDRERMHKASEMLANAQIAVDDLSLDRVFIAACQELHAKDAQTRLQKLDAVTELGGEIDPSSNDPSPSNQPNHQSPSNPSPSNPSPSNPSPPNPSPSNPSPSNPSPSNPSKNNQPPNNQLNGNVTATPTELKPTKPAMYDPVKSAAGFDKPVQFDKNVMQNFREHLAKAVAELSLDALEQLHAALADVAWQHRRDWDRTPMLRAMLGTVGKILQTK